jgi:hypothetical protein
LVLIDPYRDGGSVLGGNGCQSQQQREQHTIQYTLKS